MSKKSVSRIYQIRKRVADGFKLFSTQVGQITSLGFGFYKIPSQDPKKRIGPESHYLVTLGIYANEEERCSCIDYSIRKDTCKHIVAATLFRAKEREEQKELVMVA